MTETGGHGAATKQSDADDAASVFAYLRRFMLEPVLEQRPVLVTVVVALVFMSLTQGLGLLLIKGFLAAFFTNVSSPAINSGGVTATSAQATLISVASLLPAKLQSNLPTSWNVELNRSDLAWFIPVGIVVAGALKALAGYIYTISLGRLSLKVAQNYREKVFAGILELPWLTSATRGPGEWMSVVMSDAIFIQSRLTDFSTAFLKDGVLIISCMITLSFIHWPAALVLLVLAPIIGWQMGMAGRRIAWFTEAFQRELGVLAGRLLGIRERFRFMRAQGGEEFEAHHFAIGNRAYLKMMNESIFLRALIAPGMEWVGFAIFAAFIYGWTRKVPGFDVAPDVVIQFFVALGLILRPVREMGEQVARWSETVGGLRRSMRVMREVDELKLTSSSLRDVGRVANFKTSLLIDIKSVTIAYQGRAAFSAENIALVTRKAVAIIGPSGAGKSTFVKCLAGLMPPEKWEASAPWAEVAGHTSLVSQTPFLFKDTLRRNLLYGLPEPIRAVTTDEMVWGALKVVNLVEVIGELKHGLESMFNPLETNLSGGQIQRLVIARALLRRPSILMLDEATSAVDGASEYDISKRLIETVHETGTILLAVTHRLRWLEMYDEVWFVENGKVMLSGPHRDLLAHDRYRLFAAAEDKP
jgi:ATP-binding cassette, subfamily B, bacterial MsbA